MSREISREGGEADPCLVYSEFTSMAQQVQIYEDDNALVSVVYNPRPT